MIPEDSIQLWSVIHGSHMWGMQHSESDVDVATIYQVPTKTILSGRPYDRTRPQTKREQKVGEDLIKIEDTFWEIGHLVSYLLKGNCNAIWMTNSCQILSSCDVHEELRTIVKNNLAKNVYHSIKGMAASQISDATKRNLGMKGLRSAWRTLNFGINVLDGRGILFEPAPEIVIESDCTHMLVCLKDALEGSNLPEIPETLSFYDYLYKIRLLNLNVSLEVRNLNVD